LHRWGFHVTRTRTTRAELRGERDDPRWRRIFDALETRVLSTMIRVRETLDNARNERLNRRVFVAIDRHSRFQRAEAFQPRALLLRKATRSNLRALGRVIEVARTWRARAISNRLHEFLVTAGSTCLCTERSTLK
jgi:phosphatidylserine/phosphatidylglycerophosphate/cardiolipin synthase-like enzyme